MSKEQNSNKGEKALHIGVVVCCARCGEKLSDEMLQEQKNEIEMECDALCKKHWEDDRLYMADLVMH
jgi:hypothetical protein